MGLYGGGTPKRHVGFSNCACVGRLDLGPMRKTLMKKLKETQSTTHTYVDKRGRKRFHGTKSLKETQSKPHLPPMNTVHV